MGSLKPIQNENILKLLEVLKHKLPDSIVPYHWIKTQIDWIKNTPGLKLQILTLNGDWNDGSALCLADGLADSNKMYSIVYATVEKEESFKQALLSTDLVEWSRIKYFSATLERNLPMMAEVLKAKGYKHTGDFHVPCHLHYMSVEDAANSSLPELPENIRVGPLEECHLDIVCENWRHYDPEYRPIVLNEIKLNPTIGVFVKNERGEEELTSMVLQSEYGAAGLLQTVPEHRRKGYAEIAMAHITKKLGLKRFMPYGAVLVWNEGSSILLQKLGYKIMGVSTWILLIKEDGTDEK